MNTTKFLKGKEYRDALRSIIDFALLDTTTSLQISNFILAMNFNSIFEEDTLNKMSNFRKSKREIIRLLTELITESLEDLLITA